MTRELPPQHDSSTVRHYRADGTLTVTRDDETNEHVIKSRGRDPDDKWTRRVPATRTDVEEGDKLRSIPDNWMHSYTLKPDYGHKKEIYHIPETGEDVLVSLTHPNSYLVDAWHSVKAVGEETWIAHAEVDQDALTDAITFVNDHANEFDDGVVYVLQYVRENPREAVEGAEDVAATHAPEAVEDWNGIPAGKFDPWRVSFRNENGLVSHPDCHHRSDVMADVRQLLAEFDVVPPSPLVSVTVR
jgi:hypothetical protein